jgi:hypothetical protein
MPDKDYNQLDSYLTRYFKCLEKIFLVKIPSGFIILLFASMVFVNSTLVTKFQLRENQLNKEFSIKEAEYRSQISHLINTENYCKGSTIIIENNKLLKQLVDNQLKSQ